MNLRLLFALWTGQGMVAFAWLALLPSDSGGFSASRWILLGAALALSAVSAWGWGNAPRWENRPALGLPPLFQRGFRLLAVLAVLLPLPLLFALQALGQTVSYTYGAYASRLLPLALWFSLAGLEWTIYTRWGEKLPRPPASFWWASAALLLTAGLMRLTAWGLTPTKDGSFGSPSSPLYEWQILLALVLALLATRLPRKGDAWVFGGIYLFTALLWLLDPLQPGFFATPPRAPNFEIYPFSDALIYAQYAQSALAGEGLLYPDVPTRPLYVSLLVWMHALAGQDYERVITLQTLWLALFPALLYLLGKEAGSRPLGVMLAALAALRDVNANHAAPFALNYTYSKLYFSELPAALLVTLFTILTLRWLKTPKPGWYALLLGGILGAAALIRLQSAVLLAPVGLAVVWVLWQTRRGEALRGVAWMFLGLSLALAPWLARNYAATGGIVLDNPISQAMVFARRWSGDNGNDLIPRREAETTAQYSSRMTAIALEALRQNPQRILSGAANHFFNNLFASLYIFPVRDRLNAPQDLWFASHAFWQVRAFSLPLTVLYLLLFAIGVSCAWESQKWLGLLPLLLALAYHAWTALFLSSGDRFLVPIDWATTLYLAWGTLRAAEWALAIPFSQGFARFDGDPDGGKFAPAWGRVALTGVFILLVGASIPLSEKVFPPLEQDCPADRVCGRAVYPRFYAAGEGEPGTAKMGYGVSPQARLVFWMVGKQPGLVIVPLAEAPKFLPHAANVQVRGAWQGEVLWAQEVLAQTEEQSAILLSSEE